MPEKEFSSKQPDYSWIWLAILLITSLWVSILLYNRGFSSYDDGVAAEGGWIILHGGTPYRDFWTVYSPAYFYANALSMLVFGDKLISIRLFVLLSGIIQTLLIREIFKRRVANKFAAITAFIAYLAVIPLGIQSYWFTAVLTTIYSMMRALEDPRSKWWYWCGGFAALALLFRQDCGIYLAVVMFPLVYFVCRNENCCGIRPLKQVITAYLVVVGACVLFFALKGALKPMIQDAVIFAALKMPKARPLPYPLPWQEAQVIDQYRMPIWIAFFYQLYGFYLMPVILIAMITALLRDRTPLKDNKPRMFAFCLICVAVMLFLMVHVRPSGARIMASAVLSACAFAILCSDQQRLIRIGSSAALVLSLAAFVPAGVYITWAYRSCDTTEIPGTGGVFAPANYGKCMAVTAFRIHSLTTLSERILCGSPFIYYMTDRKPATRYYEPHPLLTDTPAIQKTIIRDIKNHHLRYFVRSREWGEDSYFTIEPEHKPKMLLNYINKHFELINDYANYQIYRRKD